MKIYSACINHRHCQAFKQKSIQKPFDFRTVEPEVLCIQAGRNWHKSVFLRIISCEIISKSILCAFQFRGQSWEQFCAWPMTHWQTVFSMFVKLKLAKAKYIYWHFYTKPLIHLSIVPLFRIWYFINKYHIFKSRIGLYIVLNLCD